MVVLSDKLNLRVEIDNIQTVYWYGCTDLHMSMVYLSHLL